MVKVHFLATLLPGATNAASLPESMCKSNPCLSTCRLAKSFTTLDVAGPKSSGHANYVVSMEPKSGQCRRVLIEATLTYLVCHSAFCLANAARGLG